MTRPFFLLLSATTVLGLAAEQPSQQQKFTNRFPLEAQIGASYMQYGTPWPSEGKTALAPSIRLSMDVLPFPGGSLLINAGYRFGNSVGGEYGQPAVGSVKHDGQFQFGALVRFEAIKKIEVGLGLDMRQDQLKAKTIPGMEALKETDFKPWLRFTARYMFDRERDITPFVGIEIAGRSRLDAAHSYFPEREFALVGGIRFGRRPQSSPPSGGDPEPQPPPPPNGKEERKAALEAIAKAEAEKRKAALEAIAKAEEEARKAALEAIAKAQSLLIKEGVKLFKVHFATGSSILEPAGQELVKKWADDYWNKGQYKELLKQEDLIITGHVDMRGNYHDKELAHKRAEALANELKKYNINVQVIDSKDYRTNYFKEDAITSADKKMGAIENNARNRRAVLRLNTNRHSYKQNYQHYAEEHKNTLIKDK